MKYIWQRCVYNKFLGDAKKLFLNPLKHISENHFIQCQIDSASKVKLWKGAKSTICHAIVAWRQAAF